MRAAAIVVVAACHGTTPSSWEPVPFGSDCGLYQPRTRADLPPPIAWEPCPGDPACRRIAVTWEPDPKVDERIAPNTLATRDREGRVILHTARFTRDGTLRLVAEADGRVRVAIREQRPDRCALAPAAGDGDRYAMRIYDREATGTLSSRGGGGLGGTLDAIHPQLLLPAHDTLGRSYSAGTPGLLEIAGGTVRLHPWSGAPVELWSSARADGRAQHYAVFHGDAVVWSSDDLARQELLVWTAAVGVRRLAGYGDDWTRGVADLGSDGRDLVWLEGSGRTRADQPYPHVAIVTAPFTTDPKQLRPRSVRADLAAEPFGTEPFVVGCGRAARVSTIAGERGTYIVGLADGGVRKLRDRDGWQWLAPLALTCDELFVKARDHGRITVARVRLDPSMHVEADPRHAAVHAGHH